MASQFFQLHQQREAVIMPLWELDLWVHLKDRTDGYPMCWSKGRMGLFEAAWNEADVTCPVCKRILKE